MNENFEQLVARFLASDKLSPEELIALRDELSSNSQLVSLINDDRAIHAILQSPSLTSESFVAGCVDQFRRLDLDTSCSDLSELNDVSRRRLPIGNDLAAYRSRIMPEGGLGEPDVSDAVIPGSETPAISNEGTAANGQAANGTVPNIASITPGPSQINSDSANNGSAMAEASRLSADSSAEGDAGSIGVALAKNNSGYRRKLMVASAIAASLVAIIGGAIWFNSHTNGGAASGIADSHDRGVENVTAPELPDNSDLVVVDDSHENELQAPDPQNLPDGELPSPSLEQEKKFELEQPIVNNLEPSAPPSSPDPGPANVAGFATVYSGQAIWKHRPWPDGTNVENGVAVNAVMLELESGTASVKFANGARLDLLGASDAQIVKENSIVLGKGTFMLNIPSFLNGFTVNTSTTLLDGSGNLNAQIAISEQGVIETYLFAGSLNLIRKGAPDDTAIRLTKGQLEHVVMSPRMGNENLPSITMARGGDGGFVGQLGMERNVLKVDSPPIFAQLMHQFAPDATKRTDVKRTELGDAFEKAFENFGRASSPTPAPAPNANETSPSNLLEEASPKDFSGSLSLNGKIQMFDSPEDYYLAIKQHFHQLNQPFDLDRNSGSRLGELSFEIGGMEIRFSDLKQLEERRKQMREYEQK